MEFNEVRPQPPNIIDLLYNQVIEQSDLCDVTIRHGVWERRFHWCVLVASPYFENIRKHSYVEMDSGVVTMQIGTPESWEEGILFLYGKKPNIRSSNVAALLEVAEYILIPQLKAECVQWITDTDTETDENCLSIIKLSSLYEFTLPMCCEKYMRGRLTEMMQMDAMLELTADSVQYILEDTNLSYVKSEDKFSFLIRWVKSRERREPSLEKFLGYIDFPDMEKVFVEDVVLKEPLVRELGASSYLITKLESINPLQACEVLRIPHVFDGNALTCFDISRNRWCTLKVEENAMWPAGFSYKMIKTMTPDLGKDRSQVYTHGNFYSNGEKLYKMDFKDKSVQDFEIQELTHSTENRCLGEAIKYVHNDEILQVTSRGFHMKKMKCKFFQASTLQVGKMESERSEIVTQPVFSFKGTVSHVIANGTTIAMFSINEKLLHLYDKDNCCFKTIDFEARGFSFGASSKLAKAGDGFVIFDNLRFTYVARQRNPVLSSIYLINQYNFPTEKTSSCNWFKYFFCENKWYRFSSLGFCYDSTMFESTTHEQMLAAVESQAEGVDDVWTRLPSYQDNYAFFESIGPMFQIKVPKEMLFCALNCPHCKQLKEEAERKLRNIHENDYDIDDFPDVFNDDF